jgi:diguanylate cyclase (GGDEF)-like protein/PAS domain S-box-containing protein
VKANQVSHIRAELAFSDAAGGIVSSEEVFRVLTAQTPVGIFVSSRHGKFEYVNRRWCDLTGLSAEQALGDGWRVALHPGDSERAGKAWEEATRSGRDSVIEYRFLRHDGSVSWIEGYAAALRNEQGEIIGWVGTCLDMTSRRAAEEAVIAAGERFRAAFDNAPIGMGLVTPEGRWLQVNAAFCRLLGSSEEVLLGLSLADLTVPGDVTVQVDEAEEARSETRYLRADGAAVWVAASTTLVRDAHREPLYYVVQVEDIGDRKQTESELRLLADHDSLTGLLNRRGFMEGMARELHRMERNGEYGALLLLDLDNFKLVNDTAGHPVGDQVLRSTADVLRGRLRATDIIGRIGGDEFAAVVLNVSAEQAREIAEQTTEAIRAQPVTTPETTLEVTASIGVVTIDGTSDETGDDLLAAADRSMYRAKSLGRTTTI